MYRELCDGLGRVSGGFGGRKLEILTPKPSKTSETSIFMIIRHVSLFPVFREELQGRFRDLFNKFSWWFSVNFPNKCSRKLEEIMLSAPRIHSSVNRPPSKRRSVQKPSHRNEKPFPVLARFGEAWCRGNSSPLKGFFTSKL